MRQRILKEIPAQKFDEQFKTLRSEILGRVEQVFSRGQFILGQEVKIFENDFARWLGVAQAVGCASGSDALLLSLMALGVKSGDEVITTPLTFFATGSAIVRQGAKPVFVDIDPLSYNMNVAQIEGKITSKTRGILPVHLYGQSCRMDRIMDIAAKRKLWMVEDCAQAHGTKYKGRTVGTFGEFGCFSFYPTKNLGAYGDAGMIVTSEDSLAQEIRILRSYGTSRRDYHDKLGVNSRLDEVQAAILNVKLKYLDTWITARREKAYRYNELFKESGLTEVRLPFEETDGYHTYHLYVIRVSDRDSLLEHLTQSGIQVRVYYPVPLHLEKAFDFLGYQSGAYPEAEKAASETLALPLYPELSDEEQVCVVEKVKEFYRS